MVAEALSCSLPVLISDSVNIYDVIQSNNCGLVCTPSFHGVDSSKYLPYLDTSTKLQYSMKLNKLLKSILTLPLFLVSFYPLYREYYSSQIPFS